MNIKRMLLSFLLVFCGCFLQQINAMQKTGVDARKELSLCSVCQEPVLRSDPAAVYGPQVFDSCDETHAHHDEHMAQLLEFGGADARCPYCRASLRSNGPAANLAPLSRAMFERIRLQPREVHYGPVPPTLDDLLAMALAGTMLPQTPPPVPVVIDLRPAFFAAVGSGNLEQIHQLITQGVDVNAVQPGSGKTALIIAAEAGNAAMVHVLITEGHANCDVRDAQGYTALMYASRAGNIDVMRSLFVDGHLHAEQNLDAFALADRSMPINRLFEEYSSDYLMWNRVTQGRLFADLRAGIEPVIHDFVGNETTDGQTIVDELGFTPLMYAAQNGHMAFVHALTDHGDDLLLRNHAGLTARDLAVVHGHADVAVFLAQHEPQPPSAGAGLAAHLLFAARIKDFATVQRILVDHPLLINMRDSKGRTPLMCAVLAGDEAMVRFLIAHGANIEATDYENFSSALVYAINFRKPAIVRILVEAGHASFAHAEDDEGYHIQVDRYARELGYDEIAQYLSEQRAIRRRGREPQPLERPDVGQQLREAAKSGDLDAVTRMVHLYPDVINEPDDHGDTAFLHAIDNLDIMWVLAPYVDVNYKCRQGDTALLIAVRHNNLHMVRYLVNTMHADVTIRDVHGRTARDVAVENKCQGIVVFLDNPHMRPQKPTADVIADFERALAGLDTSRMFSLIDQYPVLANRGADELHRTPLAMAVECHDLNRVQTMVLDAHVDLEQEHQLYLDVGTPLMHAAASGYLDIVQFLIRHGRTDQKRSLALIKATQNGYMPIVQFLCTHGHVDPNIQEYGNRGFTALMCAACFGYMPIVHYLITEMHADPNIVDTWPWHRTAYDEAIRRNHPEIAEFLAAHGGLSASVIFEQQQERARRTGESSALLEHKKRCCTIL